MAKTIRGLPRDQVQAAVLANLRDAITQAEQEELSDLADAVLHQVSGLTYFIEVLTTGRDCIKASP